ncbi:cyclic pyranopterin monophosphate synthase MoaC [Allorhodopirellula solitaria]|uniref:Cyclic pyranopterin monophosphate synthase n=1 Tax=Allorhodopirellula solitaria TaxID=2527987 RepID=A0A5C5XQG1_9BACT|nr:cyclic pyranopterin monophosphate synthase MoaC [Allorhodopirellula solitaria]TWT64839.1 Cyclic pyranopterin monophosphate synthase accessory protein [Allorhodopirellula solitaria]
MSRSDPPGSTHFNHAGQAHMVDVTGKPVTSRVAVASSTVRMNPAAAAAIRAGSSRKGDVLGVARLAAISATKWTSTLIPLCHAIPVEGVEVQFTWLSHGDPTSPASPETLQCEVTVRTTSRTGVEMEALTAASVAALTVYDMLKSVDRAMEITATRLESKSGGKSGDFSRA